MNRKGFTIIETMFAMSILAIGMMSAVQLHYATAKNNRNGNVLTIAMMAVKERVEVLRGQDVMDLVEGDHTEQVGLVTVRWAITKNPDNFRVGQAVVTGEIRGKTARIETKLNNWKRRDMVM